MRLAPPRLRVHRIVKAMKTTAAVAVLAMLGGCAMSGLTIANGTALGVSTATLACDWWQTRTVAAADWPHGKYEGNPLIGPKPSASTVDLYFAGVIAASVLAWRLMPRRWRMIIPSAIIAVQARAMIVSYGEAMATNTPYEGVCGSTGL